MLGKQSGLRYFLGQFAHVNRLVKPVQSAPQGKHEKGQNMKITLRKRLIIALVKVKVGRSRFRKTARLPLARRPYGDYCDAVCELYQVIDELNIGDLEGL